MDPSPTAQLSILVTEDDAALPTRYHVNTLTKAEALAAYDVAVEAVTLHWARRPADRTRLEKAEQRATRAVLALDKETKDAAHD